MRAVIEAQLQVSLDQKLVSGLLDAHEEAKGKFYLGGLRLSEVEAGRFCEAAFRLLEEITTKKFTPLGNQLNTTNIIRDLKQLPKGSFPDSVRLHIPRALQCVYDVRNNRDAAHLADGIDPNLQDASLVASVIDWVLAEFIRLYHPGISATEAHELVDEIVTRKAPVVQDFGGYLKVLNPSLKAGDHCLVVLYQRGSAGATLPELSSWVRPRMRKNLKVALSRLENNKDCVHFDGNRYFITRRGQLEVEKKRLLDPG